MFGQRANAGGTGDCAQDVKNWWKNCPFFYKFIFTTSIIMWLCTMFLSIIPYMLINYPIRTVQGFFLWTPFTSFLVPRDVFSLLIGIYLVYRDGKMIEQRIGSAHYCIELFFKNFLIQLGYIILMYIGYFIFGSQQLLQIPSLGLFPTFMMFLALRGLADPEQQTNFCCFPILIKQKYYVWILYGIFALLSQSLVPDILSAIGVAYLEVYGYNGQILKISQEKLKRLENSFLFKKISSRSDFITVDNAGSMNLEAQLPVSNNQQQNQQQQSQSSAFAGRGVQIGQQSNVSQDPPQVINPSLNENNYRNTNQNNDNQNQNQNEVRKAAAEAAQRRFEMEQAKQEKENQEDQQQENQVKQDSEKKETKKGYAKFEDEENNQGDLI